MALTNVRTGEYIKVTGFQFDYLYDTWNISYLRFANRDQRERFETGLSNYERFDSGQYNSTIIKSFIETETGKTNTKDALFEALYKSLKSDMFNEWTDC